MTYIKAIILLMVAIFVSGAFLILTRVVAPQLVAGQFVSPTFFKRAGSVIYFLNPTYQLNSATITDTLVLNAVTSCTEALETNSNGEIVCGTDSTGGSAASIIWNTYLPNNVAAPTNTAQKVAVGALDATSTLTVIGTTYLQGRVTTTDALIVGALQPTLNLVAGDVWAGRATVTNLTVKTLTAAACDVKSDTSGNLACGTDANSGTGGTSQFNVYLPSNTLAPTDTAASVGIGTQSVTSTLSVLGSAYFNGAVTTTNYLILGALQPANNMARGDLLANSATTTNLRATNFNLNGDSFNDITGTGLAVAANALTVSYGSSAGTAAQGNTSLTLTAGTGLSGGGSWTVGAGSSVTVTNAAGMAIWNTYTGAIVAPTNTSALVGIGNQTATSTLSVTGNGYFQGNVTTTGYLILGALQPSTVNMLPGDLLAFRATTTNLAVTSLNAAACTVKATTNGVVFCGTDAQGNWQQGAGFSVYTLVPTSTSPTTGIFVNASSTFDSSLRVNGTLTLSSVSGTNCLDEVNGVVGAVTGDCAANGQNGAWQTLATTNVLTPTSSGAGIVVNAASSTVTQLNVNKATTTALVIGVANNPTLNLVSGDLWAGRSTTTNLAVTGIPSCTNGLNSTAAGDLFCASSAPASAVVTNIWNTYLPNNVAAPTNTAQKVAVGALDATSTLTVIGTTYLQGAVTTTSYLILGALQPTVNMVAGDFLARRATTTNLTVSTLTAASCDVKADTSGNLSCGTDATGGAGTSIIFNSFVNGTLAAPTNTSQYLGVGATDFTAAVLLEPTGIKLTVASSTALNVQLASGASGLVVNTGTGGGNIFATTTAYGYFQVASSSATSFTVDANKGIVIFPLVDTPSLTATGSIAYNTEQGNFVAMGGSGAIASGTIPRVLAVFATTTDTVSASVTTNEQSFQTNYTIPANFIIKKKVLRVTACFQETTSGSAPTITMRLRLGGGAGTLVASGQVIASNSLASQPTCYDFVIIGTAAPGSSVNVITHIIATQATGGLGFGRFSTTAQPVAVATNASKVLQFTAQWSATTAGNSIDLQALIIEELN